MMTPVMSLMIFGALLAGGEKERFLVESEFGKESAWTEPFLNDAWKVLVRLMDNGRIKPPRGIGVTLEKDPDFGGIGGYASPVSIGFTSNAWPKDRDRIWILAHELTNLFAAHYGGAGGYPADWWANGRSPFPEYVSCLVMEKLGYSEAAAHRKKGAMEKADHVLFWKLHKQYGFRLFSRFFKLVNADGLDMGNVGRPWPFPDEARAAYTIAYLSIAAGTNLAPLCREHLIGREPSDWRRIHPEIVFLPYNVTEEEVEGVIAVREVLFSRKARGKGIEILRELYRSGGTYPPSQKEAGAVAGEEGPIAFTVHSEFGIESEWTKSFLERTAAALVRVFDLPDDTLPGEIKVTLRKDPSIGGIGGGVSEGAIDLISDCWPEERFRHWILSQELASLIAGRLGGNLPDDWWGHGGRPFVAYASSLVLKEVGLAGEADWVHGMHRERRDHELLWALHEKLGTRWVAPFFRLLREDGINFEILAAGESDLRHVRSLYLITYLSLAGDDNVADLCTDRGIGAKPADWDSRNEDSPFRTYRVTSGEVKSLMARREKLFAGGGDTKKLRAERERFRRGEDVAVSLPRVLIIGDSISIGYTEPLRKILEGRAVVMHNPGNAEHSGKGLVRLDEWLGEGDWDVIHFNHGLHDLKYVDEKGKNVSSREKGGIQIPLDEYEKNIEAIVLRLKETGARLIFATTTPFPDRPAGPLRESVQAGRYNAAALKIMKKHGVAVNDLYSFALPRLKELQKPNNVHFTPQGSAVLAREVGRQIMAAAASTP